MHPVVCRYSLPHRGDRNRLRATRALLRDSLPVRGSSYLSGNLDVTTTDGIRITASGVTLDLNGFSIFRSSGAAATGTAIKISASGNVSHSYGVCTAGKGIYANYNITNSHGQSSENIGIQAFFGNISNSRGLSSAGAGILANIGNVSNSYGRSTSGDGISGITISYSRGITSNTGVGIRCTIAIGCTTSGGQVISNKYLMP